MGEEMTENEKKLLLQLLLKNMRGSFPLAGWNDGRMKKAYDLAIELDFKPHAEHIKNLADYDGYRDGRHFRTDFESGGYEGMEKCHGLKSTYEDKSVAFQREARNYLEYIENYFDDWKLA